MATLARKRYGYFYNHPSLRRWPVSINGNLYQTRSIFKFLYENSLRTMKFILTKRTHFTVVYLFWGIKGSLFIMGNDNRFSS